MYDYLIVGCGLFGATFSRLATDSGKSCLIIDKRNHIGGNCYTENIEGINVHKYGAHIFHTNNKVVWDFINRFAEFNNYIHFLKASYKGKLYSLPFNMNTFYEMWGMWGVTSPTRAKEMLERQKFKGNPKNLEEQALSLVGKDIYEILIKGYTQKHWGRHPKELPSFIIKRLPLRFTFDNNYFNDKYQGIPIGGYTQLIDRMLNGIEVKLNTDYFSNRDYFNSIANQVVYTGCIGEFFDYEFGELEYRSLKFETEVLNTDNYQGNSVINYTDIQVPYTRIIEHKHFEKVFTENTIITKEYSQEYEEGMIPYYPINNKYNQTIYNQYKEKSKSLNNIVFGGRLAEYKYMDMDTVINLL